MTEIILNYHFSESTYLTWSYRENNTIKHAGISDLGVNKTITEIINLLKEIKMTEHVVYIDKALPSQGEEIRKAGFKVITCGVV